ncbi:MAG: hypothetical protein IT223_01215 [Crocinitomicaceae bacterium]|nr:hypothetical protein [Crocinitomicaceae bacterium]
MPLHKLLYILFMLPLTAHGQTGIDPLYSMYKSGNYETAIQQADVFLKENPDHPEALKIKADCYQKMMEYDLALANYDRARLSGYKQSGIYLNRGICKLSMDMTEEARIDLVTYISKEPEDAKGYYWMGTLEYLNLDNKASLRYLNEALLLDSTYSDAYYLRAANYIEQKKNLFAMDDFEMAYRFNPQLYRAKMNMAVILLDMGNYNASLELLSELQLEDIDFVAEVLYYRGETLFMMHDSEGACKDWKEAAVSGDRDAQENYQRLCLNREGKPRFKRRSYGQF